jgi:hypothetical protein
VLRDSFEEVEIVVWRRYMKSWVVSAYHFEINVQISSYFKRRSSFISKKATMPSSPASKDRRKRQ